MKKQIALRAEIAVIGAGPAGLSAAITAARAGKDVLLIEKNGYLEAMEKEHKKYKRPLELTEKGLQTGKHISERIDSILETSSDGVSEEERNVLYLSLSQISENLQKICDRYDN